MSPINILVIVVVSFLTAIHPQLINGLVCKGCLEIDDLTFDKILAKFSTVVVKFDVAFPYGKKHEAFAKFSKEISESNYPDLIACVVGIKNYGDSTNNKLAKRFSIVDQQLPAIKLFTNHNALNWIDFPKGALLKLNSVKKRCNPTYYLFILYHFGTDQNITKENLRQFIRRQSDVNILLPDCLLQFDEYAKEFVDAMQLTTAIDTLNAETILNDASNEATKLETVHVCHQ